MGFVQRLLLFWVVTVLLLSPQLVLADESVESLGTAPLARGADEARRLATEQALVQAVDQVVSRLLPGAARQKADRMLRARIFDRPRRFVSSFQVIDERQADGQFLVRVRAKIATRTLSDAMVAAGIALPDRAAPAPALAVGGTVLVGVAVQGSSGDASDLQVESDIVLASSREALAAALSVTGRAIEPAQASSFDALASELETRRLQVGVWLDLEQSPGGPIRGTSFTSVAVSGIVRVLARDGALWERRRVTAGWDAAGGRAAEQGAARASEILGRHASGELATREQRARAVDVMPIVVVSDVSAWSDATTIRDAVLRSPGVRGVTVVGLARGRVELRIDTTLSAAAVARLVQTARANGLSPSVTVKGGRIEAQWSGKP